MVKLAIQDRTFKLLCCHILKMGELVVLTSQYPQAVLLPRRMTLLLATNAAEIRSLSGEPWSKKSRANPIFSFEKISKNLYVAWLSVQETSPISRPIRQHQDETAETVILIVWLSNFQMNSTGLLLAFCNIFFNLWIFWDARWEHMISAIMLLLNNCDEITGQGPRSYWLSSSLVQWNVRMEFYSHGERSFFQWRDHSSHDK